MSLSLSSSLTAVGPNITSSFLAVGGTTPYSYSVLPGGAGGTIDSSTGLYTAPAVASSSPNQAYDTIQVIDASNKKVTAEILVGNTLVLFCDILQTQMNLPSGRVYEWNQKIFQPSDYGLYIAVSVPNCKPFGNANYSLTNGNVGEQDINMSATYDLDLISRGPAARDQKELVLLAMNSIYSQQQQEANSFYVSKLSTNFLNLSEIDGSAIPYRYRISYRVQYTVSIKSNIPYFGTFETIPITVNP